MRIGTSSHDGQTFQIAELTYKQMEELFSPGNQTLRHQVVIRSLNNAAGSEDAWTWDKLKESTGPKGFDLLYQDILKFCDIPVTASPGESPAADLTSGASAASS